MRGPRRTEEGGEVDEGEAADRQLLAGAGWETGERADIAAGEAPGFDGLVAGGEGDGCMTDAPSKAAKKSVTVVRTSERF